jgi:signal peptidase II
VPSDVHSADVTQRRHPGSVLLGLTVAVVFVVIDQVTKEIAEAVLEPGRFRPLLGEHIGWQLVYNPGGAFGVRAPHWIFLAVTVIVVLVVARALPRTPSRFTAAAYGLLLAGALGNVVDRLFRDPATPDAPSFGGGAVVDFVAWGAFPRFNVADSAITVGFVLLVVALWNEERRSRAVDEAAASADGGDGAADGGDGAAGDGEGDPAAGGGGGEGDPAAGGGGGEGDPAAGGGGGEGDPAAEGGDGEADPAAGGGDGGPDAPDDAGPRR